MARTPLTPVEVNGPYDATLSTVTWTAADVANKNQFTLTGRELILIHNADGVSAHNIVLTSIADPYGRTGNVSASVAANGYRAFWIGALTGWLQSDGKFYLEADSTQIEFAILKID